MHGRGRYGLSLLLLVGLSCPALADSVTLVVRPGSIPGDVELEWTGGQPPFRVYRGSDAAGVTSPARLIGQTSARTWIDAAPAGGDLFYRVTGAVTIESTSLTYGSDPAQTLDLYVPQDPPAAPMPVTVLAHGGLWQSGDKSALTTLCENIVRESGGTHACASINYRLSQNLGGVCTAPGVDTYEDQIADLAAAYALLQNEADARGLAPSRMYIGGHSAGGHLGHEFNLRWPEFAQGCTAPSGCPPAAGAIGFEGIYDIAAWDDYDDAVWGGQFSCATRKAFGFPPQAPAHCVDDGYDLPCWDVGSPIYLALNAGLLGIAPAGDALVIHSPGDTWVDIAEATHFGGALNAAFPTTSVITSTDGTCAAGQHNDPLSQVALARCIVNFVASRGAGI